MCSGDRHLSPLYGIVVRILQQGRQQSVSGSCFDICQREKEEEEERMMMRRMK